MPLTAVLFDAEGHDAPVTLDAGLPTLTEHQLLWVDLEGTDADPVDALQAPLRLDDQTRSWLVRQDTPPSLHRLDDSVHLSVDALAPKAADWHPLRLVAGQNLVLTAHEGPVAFLEAFRSQLESDTQLGQLDAASFLAVLLTQHVEAFVQQLSPVEARIDQLDEQILSDPSTSRDQLKTLATLRHQVSELRRRVDAHRPVYVALASPDFAVFQDDEPEVRLTRLLDQFQQAQEAVSRTRESVLGSFDLLMGATGQQTNDVMRTLTVITVTLGIVAAVAGLMGMNFKADVFNAGNTGFQYLR